MSGKLNVEKWDATKHGPLTTLNVQRKLEKEGYRTTQYEFTPGTVFPDHSHAISKKDAIASGRFRFEMYGQEVTLEPGDMVEVPKGTVHSAAVIGNQSVIFFDATK